MENKKKFHQKMWFTVLMMVFIAPVGIILMWKNGFFSKNVRIVLTVILLAFFIHTAIQGQKESEERDQERQEQLAIEEEAEAKEAEEQAEKEEEEKEQAEKEAKEEEERLANRSIDEVFEDEADNVDEVDLHEGTLQLYKDEDITWSENSFMTLARELFGHLDTAFDDEEVNTVQVIINTEFTDNKGNEETDRAVTYTYDRDTFEELEFENFKDLSVAEEWRILQEADNYFVHPALLNGMKDEYKNNL